MSNEELAKFAAGVKVAEFKPKSVKIATTDAEGSSRLLSAFYLTQPFLTQIIAKAEAEAGGGFDSDQLSQMFAKLPSDISKV
jgi:hypothetical protein